MKLYFSPLTINGLWANFEVHGCIEHDSHVEQCDGDEQPDFYSVYVRYLSEEFRGLECIADCDDRDEADQLVRFLEKMVDFHVPNQDKAKAWWFSKTDDVKAIFAKNYYPNTGTHWIDMDEVKIINIYNNEITYPK